MITRSKPSRRPSSDEATALWEEYRATGDGSLRDRLVLSYSPLVKYIVFKKVRDLPPHCEVDDFISCGLEALIRALDRWEPSKGATLEQFVWTRIHGAVIDELRRLDWAPRSLRRWERDMATVTQTFTRIHGRPPTRGELADSLGVSSDELARREHDIATSNLTSVNSLVNGDGQLTERIDTVASDDESTDPEHEASRREASEKLYAAIEELSERERAVAILMYVKHLTLREIGDVLGVSESRVCQIHGTLKRRLREILDADVALFSEVA